MEKTNLFCGLADAISDNMATTLNSTALVAYSVPVVLMFLALNAQLCLI